MCISDFSVLVPYWKSMDVWMGSSWNAAHLALIQVFPHISESAFCAAFCAEVHGHTQTQLRGSISPWYKSKKKTSCKNTLLIHSHLWLVERSPLPLAVWWRLMGAVGQSLPLQICSNHQQQYPSHIQFTQPRNKKTLSIITIRLFKAILPRAKHLMLLINYSPPFDLSYHLPDVREQPVPKILSRLNGQLGGQVINGAHENAIPFHAAQTNQIKYQFKNYIL